MKLFSKKEVSILWPFYTEQLIANLFWILMPFEILYFLSIGLSPSQTGILTAFFPLFTLLFEVPTGAFADLYGRKTSVIMGFILMGLLFASVPLFTNFYLLIMIYALLGISYTLTSGSYDAWVVDLLKNSNQKKLTGTYFHKSFGFYNISAIFAGIIGAFFVASYSISIIWPVSAIAFFIGTGILLFAKEDHEIKRSPIKKTLSKLNKQMKDSAKYSYHHPVLFYLMVISLVMGIAGSLSSSIVFTPFLSKLGMPNQGFGYYFSIAGVLGILMSYLSHKLSKKYNSRNLLIFSSLFILIEGILILFVNNLAFGIFTLLLGISAGMFSIPLFITYINQFIPSKKRATTLSINSMFVSLAKIIGIVCAGFLVDLIGPRYTIFVSTLLIIPSIILYLRINEIKH